MKKEEVPQDNGLNMGMQEVAYAVDRQGQYVKVPSLGWEPKNIANEKAWEQIDLEINKQIRLIKNGKKSPLVYYMTINLMNPGLLASYMGLSRWKVKRHMRPKIFNRLDEDILSAYAQLFHVSIEKLKYPGAIYGQETDEDKNGNPI